MNLQLELNTARLRHDENNGLWQDSRVWWVNCVAPEAAWISEVGHEQIGAARRQRDLLLAAFIQAW
jgi:hypothetical protein